jgi:cell shape-determining protein MreC
MSKDWEELASEIRQLKARVAELEEENKKLMLVLNAADALRNHEKGIVTVLPSDVMPLTLKKVPK